MMRKKGEKNEESGQIKIDACRGFGATAGT